MYIINKCMYIICNIHTYIYINVCIYIYIYIYIEIREKKVVRFVKRFFIFLASFDHVTVFKKIC